MDFSGIVRQASQRALQEMSRTQPYQHGFSYREPQPQDTNRQILAYINTLVAESLMIYHNTVQKHSDRNSKPLPNQEN